MLKAQWAAGRNTAFAEQVKESAPKHLYSVAKPLADVDRA